MSHTLAQVRPNSYPCNAGTIQEHRLRRNCGVRGYPALAAVLRRRENRRGVQRAERDRSGRSAEGRAPNPGSRLRFRVVLVSS